MGDLRSHSGRHGRLSVAYRLFFHGVFSTEAFLEQFSEQSLQEFEERKDP
jgi:hypothetical protein